MATDDLCPDTDASDAANSGEPLPTDGPDFHAEHAFWNETRRRFKHLLFSELDAIQKDPTRSPDDRLDAWEEEQSRGK